MSVRDAVAHDLLLAAGFDAFARHGFRRTTMSDIAQAAGLSRPALYLRVTGKEEVLRLVGAALLANSVEKARSAADGEGGVAERLTAALDAKLDLTLGLAERSEHALELLEEYARVAAEDAAQYEATMRTIAEQILADTGAPPRQRSEIAAALVHTVQGLEAELNNPVRARHVLHALTRVVAAGLTSG
ncbi:TetR/AcrR family transcriptional regulator [Streptomyces sp. NPDC088387]|uniref:TetR/AcrR family transcriptional regulator n=1 Tax=Streptomyces sp. NPDC088387 TaxID=3365859 RepID=UPI00380A284D